MRTTVIMKASLLLLGLAAAPAVAAPPAPTKSAELLLGAIDVLLTPENIQKAGLTEAWATAVVDDAGARRYLRARAVGALALMQTPTARARIEHAALADADDEIRIQAVISLARAFGPADREQVTRFLRGAAESGPPALRTIVHGELARLDKQPAP